MKAILKPPRDPYTGNLLWDVNQIEKYHNKLSDSLSAIRKLGYWASPYPEGDGVTFKEEQEIKNDSEILSDFHNCFDWLDICLDLAPPPEIQNDRSRVSDEADIEITKIELALLQLEDAIELFLMGKRISVITLAGAADGIFSGLLKQRGESSAAEETWKEIEEVRSKTGLKYAGDRTKKDAFNEWNQHRNRLKHHDKRDSETLLFSAFDEAYYAIQRANLDAEKLGVKAKNIQEYDNWLIENIYM